MQSLTTFDHADAIDSTLDGLMNGRVDAGPLAKYLLRVIADAKLIPESRGWKESFVHGKKRWVAYESSDGSICRGAIERFVSSDGDDKSWSFSAPVPTLRFANVPHDAKDAQLKVNVSHFGSPKMMRGSVDVVLLPDFRASRGTIASLQGFMEFQLKNGTGKTLEFISGAPNQPVRCAERDYFEMENDGNFGTPDIDWSAARAMDAGVVSDLDALAAAIEKLLGS
jgi:hypothetical protein